MYLDSEGLQCFTILSLQSFAGHASPFYIKSIFFSRSYRAWDQKPNLQEIPPLTPRKDTATPSEQY